MKILGAAALLLVLAPAAAAQDTQINIGDPAYLTQDNPNGPIQYLRYPTLGCPTLVVRGTSGTVYVRLPDGGTTSDFELTITSTGDAFPQTFALTVQAVLYSAYTGVYTITYGVPQSVPEDMYDLHLAIPGQSIADTQPNSFKVLDSATNNFTFVVLADPQFNDPRGLLNPADLSPNDYNAFTIVEQLKKEVRAMNPTFAIVAGDLLFGLNYDFEYSSAWDVWKDAGFPVFMVPGNHDGYASIVERTVLGITQPVRDGLDHWRRYFGPNYYSFDWAGLHFQGVNSYDGTPARRDSFFIVNENYGGDLTQAQVDWIAADIASTNLPVVPWMHHNPLGPYRPNGTFGSLWWWTLNRIIDFLMSGNFDDFSQTWNTQATGQFLLAQYDGTAPVVFVGHEHHDEIEQYNSSTYKLVTTVASSGQFWGYTVARVENGQIVDYLYTNGPIQSVPTGNLNVTYTSPNNGTESTASADVQSGLSKSYSVTLEFLVLESPAYAATNGTVLGSSSFGNGIAKVWVRADTPTSSSLDDPQTVEVSVGPGVVGGSVQVTSSGSGGGGGGGCHGGGAGTILPALILLALLGLRRLR